MRRDLEEEVSEFPEKDRELARLLILAARNEIHRDYEKAPDRRYRAFLLHIENDLTNPDLDVNDARSAAGLTGTCTYAIEFSRIVGMNPAPYIEHHRMELARRLIQYTRGKITSVAFAVGYTNSSHFSDRYKIWAGHRPSMEPRANLQSIARLVANLRTSLHPPPARQSSEATDISEQTLRRMVSIEELWESISTLDEEQALAYIQEHLHSFDIRHFNFLLEKSKLEGRKNRRRGEELAGIALDMLRAVELSKRTEFLDEKIRGYVNLGNARRLIFDLIGAREAFRVVDELMPNRSTRLLLFLEVAFFKALLLWWERDLDSALGLIEDILPDLRKHASHELLTRALQLSGLLYDCKGHAEKALRMFEEAVNSTQNAKCTDPYVCLSAHYHLSFMHAKLYHGEQASALFEKVLSLHKDATTGDSEYQIVLLKAAILRANGELRAAEMAFLEAREGFRTLGADIYVALIALELSLLYLELKEPEQAFSMAISAISGISQYSAHKEAIAALAVLDEVSNEGALNRSVIGQALHHLESVRRDPTYDFLAQ